MAVDSDTIMVGMLERKSFGSRELRSEYFLVEMTAPNSAFEWVELTVDK